jgi:hypothetical protein
MTGPDFHAIIHPEPPQTVCWNSDEGGLGDVTMRPWPWAFVLMAVLTCAVTYQLTILSSWPNQAPVVVADAPRPQPLDQNSDQPLAHKDEARLQEDRGSSAAVLKSDELPVAQQQLPAEDAPSNGLPVALLPASAEEPSVTGSIELAAPIETKRNLSWLAYYAYSEYPPETKPAETVLDALKGIPAGTPIEEIKRVADILGLNFTFMKTVAKIESGFNPKQRTGSYIGLFQISDYEFRKYGSGDIRDSRDNTIAAALKIMTEDILFETFTHRKPTLNDMYLIHQQGVDGAAEHVSHPDRLAWQSMCATDEGRQKGQKWCKRAIWGNTLPAIKRVWKNVNNVTSGAFVAMWQERVSHFYARYSEAAAN